MPEHDMPDHELDRELAQQLRAYESTIPDEEVPMHARPTHRSRLLLGFGVALAGTAAGVLLAVVLLNRPSAPVGEASPSPSASATASHSPTPTPPESPSATTEPPVTPTMSPSTTPSPVAPDSREGWTPVGIGVSGPSAAINGVVPWGNGLMAFGRSETELGGIWLSEDGTAWGAAEVPDSPPDTAVHVNDVVRTETGYVAVGTLGHPLGSGPMGAVIWTSPDGLAWTEPAGADVVRDRVLGLLAVSGDTIVAGGSAIWRSTDSGATWAEIVPPSDEGWGLADLAVHDGRFIGTGLVGSGFGPSRTAIWTSDDGTAWERIDLDGDSATSLAPLPDGRLLAIGEGDNAVLAWVSDDGLTWDPIVIDSPCCITHLAATPTGVVGIGFGPSPGAVSVSTIDASTWAGETIDAELRSLIFSERFGLVSGGTDADNTPAVIFGPHPHP